MSELLKLVLNILDMGKVERSRLPGATLCFLIASVCATATVACGIATIWIFAIPRIGPTHAAALVTLILLVITLALAGIGWRMLHRPAPPPAPAFDAAKMDMLLATAGTVLGGAKSVFREHKGTLLLAAIVAGLITGNNGNRKR